MSEEHVFRFMTVRPTTLSRKQGDVDLRTPLMAEGESESTFSKSVAELIKQGVSRERVLGVVREFQATKGYARSLAQLDLKIEPLFAWLDANRDQPLNTLDFENLCQSSYDQALGDVVASREFATSLAKLKDTMLADTLTREGVEKPLDPIVVAFKLLRLLQKAAADDALLQSEMPLGIFIARALAVIPRTLDPNPLPSEQQPPPLPAEPPIPGRSRSDAQLRARLASLATAHRELSRVATDERAFARPTVELQTPSMPEGRDTGAPGDIRLAAEAAAGEPPMADGGNNFNTLRSASFLSAVAVNGLSTTSVRALTDLRFDRARINPVRAVSLIEQEMQFLNASLAPSAEPKVLLALGGVFLDRARFYESLGVAAGRPLPVPVTLAQCSFAAGVGDLLMVKQTLKAYELAEFAHVENVLAGESRERQHRRLNVREEVTEVETEVETEKERDLQSTERNELQSEAEKTVKSQFDLDAGLQISGSYGPSISFTSSLNASFSTSSEETQRKASSYSREVTEKSSERIRQRERELRRRRVLEEIEEINRHGIDNSNAANGHIRGIYRWLNKVYDAQVLNYGQRMMYEFIVPEPAAYFLYAMVENPPKDIEIEQPQPPKFGSGPLKPAHLNRGNYHDYISQYNVTDGPEPPAEFLNIAYFDKQEGKEANEIGRSGKVEIPAGYEAYAATVHCDYTFTKDKPHHYRIMIAGQNYDFSDVWGSDMQVFFEPRSQELAIAIHLFNARSFVLGVDVHCRLNDAGLAKWQHAMYAAILQAYLTQKADYEEKLAALSIQEGIQILGRNPIENRRLEREEIKKLVIMMLRGSPYLGFNSFYPGAEPYMNIGRACTNGSTIRFFENAFEWNNMMYVFYPYFWGRKPRWISALHMTDPDLDFAAFLKAGAARVQVPVRPGFERAVAHFCQYGDIWEGNDIPLRDDDLYVPIVDEITENLGKLDAGVPYPEGSEPWEVRVPTSLVVVQNLEEIPGIRDTLTGTDIALGPGSP